MKVLLTGGAGYIGSHTAVELIEAGHSVIIIDNLVNSSSESIKRVEKITGKDIEFYEGDIRNRSLLDKVFTKHRIDSVIHFAGLKSVGESTQNPLEYYSNNIDSTLVLLYAMRDHKISKLVFSSSATVYGDPSDFPLTEESRTGQGITNAYGWTKFMIEQILRDHARAYKDVEITILRYFNPVGAHKSGEIGENPKGIPNNLLPFISQVAVGKREYVSVFGDDYSTPDGTGVRDYIHVVDLAQGHLSALNYSKPGVSTYNLASGEGVSVLELIQAFSKASGKKIAYKIVDRRPGDIGLCFASAKKAELEINWKVRRNIYEACEDSWRWQSKNPDGY